MRSLFRPLAALLAASFLTAAVAVAAAPDRQPHYRPYGRGKAVYHPTPVPPYAIVNEDLLLSFRFDENRVHGAATISVIDAGGAASLAFDSIGLQYEAVSFDGKPAAYRTDAAHLYVDVPNPADTAATHVVRAIYHATPARGVYFIHPNAAYPKRAPEIWSQGETEDNRRWFPTWDEPNMKFPTSLAAIVPAAWTVISNGKLISDGTSSGIPNDLVPFFPEAAPDAHVVAWREERPHSSYLTSFVAGPYVKTHDALGGLDVDYYTHAEDAPYARQCFGRTPAMIAFFQDFTGTAYPWEKYAQTTVQEFTAGGMENVSATTQTQLAIHPPEFEKEQPCDGLVSHELAHQWFGDDVTTPDWPNIWINEGFATYFQELWSEHHFGTDQFDYERVHAQEAYFKETRRYWRPIVSFTYGTANDPFDASGYPRPAQGLHMLRTLLGDAAFRRGIKDYLAEHQYRNADTRAFERSIERSSGRDLKWFFDEWYYKASYPEFTVVDRYDPVAKSLRLNVSQKNHDGVVFTMPVTVTTYAGAQTLTKTLTIAAARGSFTIPGIVTKPDMVLFDARNNILRKLTYAKTIAQLAYQALHAPSVPDRLWAVARLGEARRADRGAARRALRAVVMRDPFYGVRIDAVDAAADLDDAQALRLALADPDPRVRIAAARGVSHLDHPGDPALVATLRTATHAPDAQVRGAALAGYGATRTRDAKRVLLAALGTPSPQDIVARGALEGLGELGDAGTIGAIEAQARYGRPERTRLAAIGALGKFAKQARTAKAVVPALEAFASGDPYFRARSASAAALGRSGRKDLIPLLRRLETADNEPAVRNAAWDAAADIIDPPERGRRRGRS